MSNDTRTVQRPTFRAPPRRSFVVTVTEGPERGQRFELDSADASRVLVGQGPACFIRLSDREVSRRHAAFEPTLDRLRLTDLGSTNGTFVGGLGVVEVLLSGGETVRIGQSTLLVESFVPREASGPVSAPALFRFGRLVGGSEPMRRIYPLCAKLAAATIPVAIEGETGTGKEVLAEALHEASPRAAAPFVVFDCTAVAPSLMESALFGHEKGAFTGAISQKRGVFEQANGGTLLIDEIGELDLALQPKLLRALQRSEIQRVGGDKWIKVDVRVIGATRRDLDREVQEGRFRDDLFYRLAVARVELPPLRRRKGDVTLLAHHFWSQLGGASEGPPAALIDAFERYEWPGNVRELYNAVSRHIALGDVMSPRAGDGSDDLDANDFGAPSTSASTAPPARTSFVPPAAPLETGDMADTVERVLAKDLPFPRARDTLLDEFERRYVARVLARFGGNIARAAAASGIARRYFQQIRARSAGAPKG